MSGMTDGRTEDGSGQTAFSTKPPYVSLTTFQNFWEGLRQGIPVRIDKSMMTNMSGSYQSQLMIALRFLRLISEDGTPTELLSKLVNADEKSRPGILREMVVDAYPFMADGFDLSTATTGTLEKEFTDLGVSGDTRRKSMAFFVSMARDAGYKVSVHVKGSTAGRNTAPRNRRTKKTTPESKVKQTLPDEPQTMTQLLLAKFPDFDPAWDAELQKKWFDSYAELMERSKNE